MTSFVCLPSFSFCARIYAEKIIPINIFMTVPMIDEKIETVADMISPPLSLKNENIWSKSGSMPAIFSDIAGTFFVYASASSFARFTNPGRSSFTFPTVSATSGTTTNSTSAIKSSAAIYVSTMLIGRRNRYRRFFSFLKIPCSIPRIGIFNTNAIPHPIKNGSSTEKTIQKNPLIICR